MLLQHLVARGARWLDRYDPTWPQRIDAGRLRDDDQYCVLGQLYGGAGDFIDTRYFLEDIDDKPLRIQIAKLPFVAAAMWFFLTHGFVALRDPEAVWKRLWENEILDRQAWTAD